TSNLVLRAFGDRTNFTESLLSMEELRGLVDDAAKQGSVPPEAGDIASRALGFGELTAADVMVHRRFVVALAVDADEAEVRKALFVDGHRRLPVYKDSPDNVQGYVLWSDVVERVWDGLPIELSTLVREAYFAPETTPAGLVLEEMQRRRNHLAIVVDEHGGLAGIVTLEDLLEELVGKIASEHDHSPEDWTLREPGGWFRVPGDVPVREVERELHLGLPEPEEWTTIGGLAIQLAGERIPKQGEEFGFDGVELVVEESSRRRVRAVRLRRKDGRAN
ncbi:MAG TPA: hemolysin family protein, partial [Planctomycetota bacterium]|nr:hemolysin family protein [Planctomycetota bacterium]